jgi:hypothetical protein
MYANHRDTHPSRARAPPLCASTLARPHAGGRPGTPPTQAGAAGSSARARIAPRRLAASRRVGAECKPPSFNFFNIFPPRRRTEGHNSCAALALIAGERRTTRSRSASVDLGQDDVAIDPRSLVGAAAVAAVRRPPSVARSVAVSARRLRTCPFAACNGAKFKDLAGH